MRVCDRDKRWRIVSVAAWAVALLALGATGEIPCAWPLAILPAGWGAWAIAAERRRRSGGGAGSDDLADSAAWMVAAALLLLATPAMHSPASMLPAWWPADSTLWGWLKSGVVRWAALSAMLTPFSTRVWVGRRLSVLLAALAAGVCAWALVRFLQTTGGTALYRDDHPTFLLRLWLAARSLPSPACYHAYWDAGRIDAAPLATGVLLLAAPLWPLWRIWPPHEVYTPVVGVALTGGVPLAAAAAARWIGGGKVASALAALLALGSARAFHLWALHFGTVPATLSAVGALATTAAVIRILRSEQPGVRDAVVLTVSLAVFLIWPPAAIMAVMVAAGAGVCAETWGPRRLFVLAAGAVAAAVVLWPIAGALLQLGGVEGFSPSLSRTPEWPEDLWAGLRRLGGAVRQGHPWLVFGGMAVLPALDGSRRRVLAVSLGGLALLTGWGEGWKPQFQLTRAVVPLFTLAVLPASLAAERLLTAHGASWREMRAGLLALLAVAAYATVNVYGNRSHAPYRIMEDEPRQLAEWIGRHVPPGARVVFAGPTVHAYGGGHVAYLPILSGRSMLACDYYHFSPATREYEFPPRAFRETDEDVFEFLDLYNAAAVATYHPHWLRFLRKYPDRFEEAAAFGRDGRRIVFKMRRPPPGQFLENSGVVEESVNELKVRVDHPDRPAVIRYHWARGLYVEPPARVRPRDVGRGVTMIEVDPAGRPEVRIRWSLRAHRAAGAERDDAAS